MLLIGPFKGKPKCRFVIHKVEVTGGRYCWFLSVTPKYAQPGGDSDVDIYMCVSNSQQKRPYTPWRPIEGGPADIGETEKKGSGENKRRKLCEQKNPVVTCVRSAVATNSVV